MYLEVWFYQYGNIYGLSQFNSPLTVSFDVLYWNIVRWPLINLIQAWTTRCVEWYLSFEICTIEEIWMRQCPRCSANSIELSNVLCVDIEFIIWVIHSVCLIVIQGIMWWILFRMVSLHKFDLLMLTTHYWGHCLHVTCLCLVCVLYLVWLFVYVIPWHCREEICLRVHCQWWKWNGDWMALPIVKLDS